MWIRYLLIFLIFISVTFFTDFSNWLSRILFALFATTVIWLLQPKERSDS